MEGGWGPARPTAPPDYPTSEEEEEGRGGAPVPARGVYLPPYLPSNRVRPHGQRKAEPEAMSGGARCCFGLLTLVAQILLHGVLALTLYWVIQYRWQDKQGLPFAWKTLEGSPAEREVAREKQWNLHPVLMITGLIYCSGQAMLVYRSCRCCRRIWNKLLHTMFHCLALPATALGFLAAYDYHQERVREDGSPDPIPHFYSIHSWLGLATMGVYATQFVVGIFSFLLLLCCESATAPFRAALVPLHSTFGTSTFLLAIATAVSGLTEKAFFELRCCNHPPNQLARLEYFIIPPETLVSVGSALVREAITKPPFPHHLALGS